MAKRPRPTLFDYALIGINPALIMLMVGSLAFFLVVVMYRGEFELRLCFILAMFVMAVVLITRISVEEGAEYASRFAIPLAFVVFLALGRFVTYPGVLAHLALLINAGLMALVWWSSHRITWDCTVIDESVEAPGEGLLQTAGFDAGNRDGVSDVHDLDAVSDADSRSRHVESPAGHRPTLASLWSKFREQSQRPHSHGMWVVYFAIAALPVFGIGQGFVDTLAGRRYVFFLFCVYLLSSLALLMTTSLLGLRRYLRQRNLEMPASMPAAWFGTGGLLIAAVLLFCLILPRPYPEYSISHLDWFATSPVTLKTNSWGTFEGKESPDAHSGSAESPTPGSATPDSAQSSQGQSSQGQSSQGQSRQSQSSQSESDQRQSGHGQSSQAESSQTQSNQSQSSQSESDQRQSGEGQSNQAESNQAESSQGESSQGESNQSQSNQTQSNQTQSSQTQSSQSESNQSDSDQRQTGQDQSRQAASSPSQANQRQSSQVPSSQPNSAAEESARRESDDREGGSQSASSQSSAERPGASSSTSPRTPSSLPTAGSVVGGFLKFLYYLTMIVVIAYLVWRFRDELKDGWQRFLEELRRLREKWGRSESAPDTAEVTVAQPAARARPFSDFANPFRRRDSAGKSPEALLRYTFSALEAWGRDHSVERQADETPLEFAQRLGGHHPALARVSRDVSLLYSQLAYGPGELPQETTKHLQRFWKLVEQQQAELSQPVVSVQPD